MMHADQRRARVLRDRVSVATARPPTTGRGRSAARSIEHHEQPFTKPCLAAERNPSESSIVAIRPARRGLPGGQYTGRPIADGASRNLT
jgi:hypothetical protein